MDIIDKIDMMIDEGTWATPKTNIQKKALNKLMMKPISAKDAPDVLYDLIGDDDLFDELDELKNDDPKMDVRPTIKAAMKRLGIK